MQTKILLKAEYFANVEVKEMYGCMYNIYTPPQGSPLYRFTVEVMNPGKPLFEGVQPPILGGNLSPGPVFKNSDTGDQVGKRIYMDGGFHLISAEVRRQLPPSPRRVLAWLRFSVFPRLLPDGKLRAIHHLTVAPPTLDSEYKFEYFNDFYSMTKTTASIDATMNPTNEEQSRGLEASFLIEAGRTIQVHDLEVWMVNPFK